jgi:hypothetical protein
VRDDETDLESALGFVDFVLRSYSARFASKSMSQRRCTSLPEEELVLLVQRDSGADDVRT